MFFGLFFLGCYAQTDLNLAASYYDRGEFEKALYLYQKLLNAQPNNSNYAFRLIKIQQELQQFKAADSLINGLLKNTKNPQYLVELGYNFQLQNQLETAKSYYNQALSQAYEMPALSYSIALKFEEHSLVDQAIEVYVLAIENTQNYSYEYRLAGLYAIKKDLENMFLSYLNYTAYNPNYKNQTLQLLSDYISEDSAAEYNRILKKIILKKLQTSSNVLWNQMLSWLFVQEKAYKRALAQEKAIFRRQQNSLQRVIEVELLAKSDKVYEVTSDAFRFISNVAQDPKLSLEAERQLLTLELLRNKAPDYKRIQLDYKHLLHLYGIHNETIDLQLSYAEFLAFHYQQKQDAIVFLKKCLEAVSYTHLTLPTTPYV